MEPDVALQDSLFRYLIKLNIIENYYKTVVLRRLSVHEGTENHDCMGVLIVRDVPDILKYLKQSVTFEDVKTIDLKRKFVVEAKKDGAYILSGRELSNKVYLHNFVHRVFRIAGIDSIEDLHKRFLPSDFVVSEGIAKQQELVGTRTLHAIAAGLHGGKGCIIRQTVFGDAGVGKTALFDATGLAAEFILSQNKITTHPIDMYFHPVKKVVGMLHTYGESKGERLTKIVAPADLGIDPFKYLGLGKKFVSKMTSFFDTEVASRLHNIGEKF